MPAPVRRRPAALMAVFASVLLTALLGFAATAQAATFFSDNFDDGDTAGWTTNGGAWGVAEDGGRVLRQSGLSGDARALAGSATLTTYRVEARVKLTAVNGSNRFVAVLARAQSPNSYYYVALRTNNTVELKKLVNGTATTLASGPFTVTVGTWYTLRLDVNSSILTGGVNGGPELRATDTQFRAGQAGVATFNAAANVDDVSVTSLDPPPTPSSPTPSSPLPPSPSSTAVTPTPGTSQPPVPAGQPVGFATVNALGQNGTTGGAGGPTVTVTTAAQFLDHIARPGPYVIRVAGTITLPTGTTDGMHDVSSDKTIVGVGSTAALVGGGLNIGLPIDDAVTAPPANAVHNVIVRNIAFSGATDDMINVQMFSHHIWIDHNDFSNGDDGAVDIKRGSDFVTVSWNRFHDHDKTMLLGHDETAAAQDTGRLRVTYHHNFFDASDQRHPRVRFAELVHVYNNYYRDNSYGIASTYNAGLFVEGNYFYSVNNPARVDFSGPLGRLVQRDNILVDCNHEIETNGTVTDPRTVYAYTADPASSVPTIVPAGAGVGKI